MGLDYKIVKADTGAMGGLLSEEFQALTDIGEDTNQEIESEDIIDRMTITMIIMTDVTKEIGLDIEEGENVIEMTIIFQDEEIDFH